MFSKNRLVGTIFPATLVGFLVFGSGYYVGHYGIPPKQPVEQAGNLVDMKNFWETKRLIEKNYPRKVDSQNLITGATKGLVDGLEDPYSAFLTADEAKQLNETLSGTVNGIGVEIGVQNEQVTVITPLPDSPASRAGIVAGDLIVAVEGQPTQGLSVDEVAKKIRGPKGTKVTIEVKSAGQAVRPLTLTRETVRAPAVSASYQNNVAIIDLSRYGGGQAKEEFDRIVADIQSKKPRGIVLDLRSNPGGYLDESIEVTSAFIRGGVVVREEFAGGKVEVKNAVQDGRLADFPLVVLVNKGTASAAEITAGALRDNRGIKLVGEKTFGKGSVQELETLGQGAILKLTIAEWLTPKGTTISKQGLEPDVVSPSENPDAQLQAALGLIP